MGSTSEYLISCSTLNESSFGILIEECFYWGMHLPGSMKNSQWGSSFTHHTFEPFYCAQWAHPEVRTGACARQVSSTDLMTERVSRRNDSIPKDELKNNWRTEKRLKNRPRTCGAEDVQRSVNWILRELNFKIDYQNWEPIFGFQTLCSPNLTDQTLACN